MRLTSRDSSDSSAAAWRVLLQRFVHMFAGTAPGVSAGTLQIVVRPFEWDVGNPAYGPYLEWTLAASIPAWGHYVTLGAAPRYVYEGYRDAIEHGFPLPASARELRLAECTNEIRWAAPAPSPDVKVDGMGVPGFSYEPSPREWLARARLGEHDPVSFRVDARSVQYDARRSAFTGAPGPEGLGFLAVANAATSRAIEAFSREPAPSVVLSASACSLLRVSPNAWYDDALVREHARRMHPIVGREREPGAGWWGPRGLLGSMTSGFILAYKPRAELLVSAETHAEIQAYRGRARQLSVGPCLFHLGEPGEGEVEVEARRDGRVRYTCQSRSEVPQVVGASARVLGDPSYVSRETSRPLTRSLAP